MSPVTQGQKVFFGVICAAALLVAVLGLFNPVYLASMFTWLVLPPLHARFVGAIYAFGGRKLSRARIFSTTAVLARLSARLSGAQR